MKFTIKIFFACLFLFSCTNNRLVRDVEKFLGQQIVLSADWNAILKGKDTVIVGYTEAPIKLIVWHDSLVCGSCEASKMYMWNNIINSADSLAPWFRIIYLFTPKKIDLNKTKITLKADRLDFPVFIDQNATFVKYNKLSKNKNLHCFLLDKENKVVMVGNPLHSPVLWSLYKKTIKKMIDNDGVYPSK